MSEAGSQSGPPPHPTPNRSAAAFGLEMPNTPGSEVGFAVILVLFTALIVDVPAAMLFRFGPDQRGAMIVGAAAGLAKLICQSIWLAWGRSHVIWRWSVVAFSGVVTSMCWSQPKDFLATATLLITFVTGGGTIAAVPRVFGFRRVRRDSAGEFHDEAAGNARFRLIDLFIWTALAAGCAAILKSVTIDHAVFARFVFGAIFCWVGGFLAIVALTAVLADVQSIRPNVVRAYLLSGAVGLLLTVGGPSPMILLSPDADNIVVNGGLLLATSFTMGLLYIPRRSGIRLIRRA